MLTSMQQTPTRVAILASSEQTRQLLSSLLEEVGLNVVAHELPGDGFLAQLESASPDVLLVDFSDEQGTETDIIDTLLDYDALPIFFNDSSPAGGGANVQWAKKLARKLLARAASFAAPADATPGNIETIPASDSAARIEEVPSAPIELTLEDIDVEQEATVLSEPAMAVLSEGEPQAVFEQNETTAAVAPPGGTQNPEDAAVNIWVLGASLGGPQAVRQFLGAIKDDLPVAFILAQHIGANHISLLAEQLNRVTPFSVLPGRAGLLIRHHEVILTPADKDIKITEDGYLSLIPAAENAIYSPSINNVISAVATHYGRMAGTIVFSGMGDDGAHGCEAMAQHGGIVWAQDVESCVISSMPDQARKTSTVTFSANPQALAERLYDYYRD
jgi:chemotaxis response regulator CheB